MNWQDFKALPERFTIRETRVQVQQPGFRGRNIIVVSTLLDTEEVTASDLASLYRARWNSEVYQPDCISSALLYRVAV
jgi:hypothetical protein